MTPIGAFLLLALQAAPPATAADSLVAAAGSEPLEALVSRARLASPALFREAVTRALAESVRDADRAESSGLSAARALASAHATAWNDPFLVVQVERFAARPLDWRLGKLEADSLRRAGGEALQRDGFDAARPLWQRSLDLAGSLGDTAASAAAHGNLGAGYLSEAKLDSADIQLSLARTLARQAGDQLVEGNALGALALVRVDQDDLVGARRLLDEAAAIRGEIGDERGAAADHNNAGLFAWALGDLGDARRAFERALALNRRGGDDAVAATNLTNLAGLESQLGEFGRAVALYSEALNTYRTADMWPGAAGVLQGLGQLELRRGDYPAARASFTEALEILDRTGPEVEAVVTLVDLAGTLAAMGEVQDALDVLREANARAEESELGPDVEAWVALGRADLALGLGRGTEAERWYQDAERLYAAAGDGDGRAEARQGLATLLLEREDYARAEQLLADVALAQASAGNLRGAALTRIFLAEARVGLDDRPRAGAALHEAIEALGRLGDPVAEALALGALAELEAESGLHVSADSLFTAAFDRLGERPAPDVSWRLHYGRGMAARSTGALDAAARDLRAAVEVVDGTASTLALPERRSAFRADRWEAYAQLALTEHMRGRTVAAFEASERLRARETLEVLHRGRLAAPAGIAGDLATREHDLRIRIAELAADVEPVDPGPFALRGASPSTPASTMREALARARDEYADLLLDIRDRTPRQAELVSPGPVGSREVARRLSADEALVEYLVTDSGSVAFVLTRDSIAALDLGIARRDLARLVEFSHTLLQDPDAAGAPWRAPLRRLHSHLIAPLEDAGLLEERSRLIIVPHAELHYLPFAALLGPDGRFVAERYALSLTPSASVWLALDDRRPTAPTRGVLAMAPRSDALPASRSEAARVAALVRGEASVLVGGEATEEAFRRNASRFEVLHLATYGVLNKHNPLFSFVDLAPGQGQDGRLEVHEVFGLDLAAELVVLSACQTALGSGALADVPAGDDWVGLTRAFLHAGARSVVATLWAVEDRSTAELMRLFYEARSRDADNADALARAQRRLLADPETAHPFHWAGVVLVGHPSFPR